MAWLKLTQVGGWTRTVNSNQISEIYEYNAEGHAVIRSVSGTIVVRESVSEIAAMIADAERLELVTRFAASIIHSDNNAISIRFKPDTVWKLAEQYVDARPEIGGK